MAPIRKVTLRQLELLVEFAEHNRGLVTSSCRKGPLAHRQAIKAWETVSRTLNACGEGAIKTSDQWKRYWHLLKCRTKGKAADNRRNQNRTEDGPNTLVPLSHLEERIVSVLGKVPTQNDPVPEPSQVSSVSSHNWRSEAGKVGNRINRDEKVPRWAYELETRRIAVEERTANALENISSSLQQLVATQAESAQQQARLVELQARLLLHLETDT